jgi:hypothetical protein
MNFKYPFWTKIKRALESQVYRRDDQLKKHKQTAEKYSLENRASNRITCTGVK